MDPIIPLPNSILFLFDYDMEGPYIVLRCNPRRTASRQQKPKLTFELVKQQPTQMLGSDFLFSRTVITTVHELAYVDLERKFWTGRLQEGWGVRVLNNMMKASRVEVTSV